MKYIESDNLKCRKIRKYDIFSVLKSQAEEEALTKKKKSRWNTFNLLPNEDQGDYEASLYMHKATAMMAAKDNLELFDKMYNEYPESAVWDFIAISNAVSYTPR